MNQDPYFVGDWESACAMLECQREACRTPEGTIFQEVLPGMASLDDLAKAWFTHLALHAEQDHIPEEDLRFLPFFAQGQSVNQGPRGVVAEHIPTGKMYAASDGKSQLANKAEALQGLRQLLTGQEP